MAKALLGHVGAPHDARMAAELRRLQRRVRELETEVEQLRAAEMTKVDDEFLTLAHQEHALT